MKPLKKLNRTSSHRTAMFANMACSLIEHGQIKTTLIKAKALKRFIEPLITRATKGGSLADRRLLISRLRQKDSVNRLIHDVAPKCAGRPGGYLSVLKSGFRAGDNAPMALVRILDVVNNVSDEKESA
jgi:large subunit ribosomal protein L17